MAKILVVDDEPEIAVLVRLSLKGSGHEVTVASDGESALKEVGAGGHDVVVLDVTMPGMNGFEVLARIKADEDRRVSEVPVVFLTARTADLDRIRGGIEGALHYLTKPFRPSDLVDIVERLVADGPSPEPELRRAAQRAALEELARLEKGGSGPADTARPHLTRLDHPPESPASPAGSAPVDPAAVAALSDKQRELLAAVRDTATVQGAAARLDVSRSNVYASLRRIARRLAVPSVPALVNLARQGGIPDPPA